MPGPAVADDGLNGQKQKTEDCERRRKRMNASYAEVIPGSSAVVRRPNCAGAESGMSDTPNTRHDREPLRTLEVLPLG